MTANTDGAHAWSAAPVRNGERFMQVQVADIRPDDAGVGEADLGIHVGAVHVDLAAVGVDDGADFLDGFLKDAVRGGIGDHDAGEFFFRARRLFAEIGEVDVALVVAGDGDDFEGGDDGGRQRVGAVGGRVGIRAQNRGRQLILTDLISWLQSADGEEAGVFALAAGVGLEGYGVEAR